MMQQKTFKQLDLLMAVASFCIAAIVYCLTIEPTASLWDCPEFIACGYKLEIGHPPGAPIFMLLSNFFAHLTSNQSHVALMVNFLSALLSAGCIFFLFLTITYLAKRIIAKTDGAMTLRQVVLIETCGWVGALCYTFSDTFWFSAVEAEVYAFSSFLTALMFWLILKWDESMEDKWIVLIAYITGLSVGVHLLSLLCLPAMSLIVYFRKTKHTTFMGMLTAIAIGGLIVGLILYGILPGMVKIGGWMELLFTNVMGLPYNIGLLFFVLMLAVVCTIAYYKAHRHAIRLSLACVLMILAGCSSYGVVFIRANANLPMNENSPGNIFALGSYLSREQYGDTPLFYGPAYTSDVEREQEGDYLKPKYEEGQAIYRPSADSTVRKYEMVRHNIKYVYKENMFFPRMHSARHAQAYENLMGGVTKKNNLPTAAENMRFFLSYQVNFMYWRYFLWNFVGRQNNIQGNGEAEHGNWITGFSFIDDWLLGCDTSNMPSDLKQNKGRNVFYAMPLLLGLLGMLWQWRKGSDGRRQLFVVAVLFVMTGLAIVVYLNQTPLQPRERDYAYAGSFYAFAIWIGLGVACLSSLFQSRKHLAWAPLLALLVPVQMASQTWDDHDRSNRYTCRDFGANYLNSTSSDGHPILFTNGDNDTFPLWYNHEVEGMRTDTRVCNLEYLNTDWYIDQMKRPAYDSPALPISWHHTQYKDGLREYVPIRPELKSDIKNLVAKNPKEAKRLLGDEPFELKNIMKYWVLSEHEDMQCIPTDTVTITTRIHPTDEKQVMTISLKGKRALYKNELIVLEILSHADWSRPVYLSISLGSELLPFLREHLVLEGLAYRVYPTVSRQQVDVERLYDNVMHRFRFGGLNTKDIYVDEDTRHLANTHQVVLGLLIDSLLEHGDTRRALEVCGKWQQEMPEVNVPYTDAALSMARCYYRVRQYDKGDAIVKSLLQRADEWLSWIETINAKRRSASGYSRYLWLKTMQSALVLSAEHERTSLYNQFSNKYENYLTIYQNH